MSTTPALFSVTVAMLLTTGGCIADEFAPDVGLATSEQCVNEDSNPDVTVRFQRDIVEGIFMQGATKCFECHTKTSPTPFGLEVGGLDLSSYETLRAGGGISGSDIVIPGAPCDSILAQKVKSGPPFGGRMPLNGAPYLSEESIQLLHDWIAEGAKNN